jgi:hypothetical protein
MPIRRKIGRKGATRGPNGPPEAVNEVRKVIIVLMVALLGVSVDCENKHAAAVGTFEQLNVTGLVNPAAGVIEIVKVVICPVRMVAFAGWLDTVKFASCTLIVAEEKVAKFASPLYTATSACDPPVRVTVRVATPDAFTGALPNEVLLSAIVTVPVGAPADELTVAVRTAGCPRTIGFG